MDSAEALPFTLFLSEFLVGFISLSFSSAIWGLHVLSGSHYSLTESSGTNFKMQLFVFCFGCEEGANTAHLYLSIWPFLCMWRRKLKIYSLGRFQVCITLLLNVITML